MLINFISCLNANINKLIYNSVAWYATITRILKYVFPECEAQLNNRIKRVIRMGISGKVYISCSHWIIFLMVYNYFYDRNKPIARYPYLFYQFTPISFKGKQETTAGAAQNLTMGITVFLFLKSS